MEPKYWAVESEGKTYIHCAIGDFFRAVAVLDGTLEETYNLPEEVLESIKDRLYAICEEKRRSVADASPAV